jgi:pyrophosphatase PpaX
MAYRTYLFDLDGTLLDTVELILSSHRYTRLLHLGACETDDVLIESMGLTLEETFRRLTPDASIAGAMVETYRQHNRQHHDAMVSAYPGVLDALLELHARGAVLAVVTSKRVELAMRGLRLANLDHLFELVVGSDHVTRGKPDPEPVHKALELLDEAASSALMIGDSPHDLHAGRAARVATAAVAWGPFPHATLHAAQPDHFIAHPRELLSL